MNGIGREVIVRRREKKETNEGICSLGWGGGGFAGANHQDSWSSQHVQPKVPGQRYDTVAVARWRDEVWRGRLHCKQCRWMRRERRRGRRETSTRRLCCQTVLTKNGAVAISCSRRLYGKIQGKSQPKRNDDFLWKTLKSSHQFNKSS